MVTVFVNLMKAERTISSFFVTASESDFPLELLRLLLLAVAVVKLLLKFSW